MSDSQTSDLAIVEKSLQLMANPQEDIRQQGQELFISLLDGGDPTALARMRQVQLLENGRFDGDLPWCDALFEVFFSHPKLQLEATGKRKSTDVLALDLSFLATQEGRVTTLSWLRLVPNLKRLVMPCQVLNDTMLDNIESLQHLEELNIFGCSFSGPLRPKLSAIAGGDDIGYSLKNSPNPEGIGIFFQCNTSDPNEISPRSYRMGAVSLSILKNNKLHRVYFIAEGYSGGGSQGQAEVRLDFNSDGSISILTSPWFESETYDYCGLVYPEADDELDGLVDVSYLDAAIFGGLRNILWKYSNYDEDEDWTVPTAETLSRLNDNGIFHSGLFDSGLFFGLARRTLGFLTYWDVPGDIPDRLQRLPFPIKWKAYRDEQSSTTFLLSATGILENVIDHLIDSRDDISYDDEGSPAFQQLIADAEATVQQQAEALANFVGWKLQGKRTVSHKYGETIYFLFTGHGWLYDYDDKLIEFSRQYTRTIQIMDLEAEIAQSYYEGYYDTGGISHPEVLSNYTKWVREVKENLQQDS